MSDKNKNVSNVAPKDPYNDIEFDVFLKSIGDSNIRNWSIMAEALGVSRQTVVRWKQHPLAKEALRSALQASLENMEKHGELDWKMWREKAKMLGVKDKQTIEHEAGEGVTELLDALQSDYGELAKKAGEKINEAD